MHQQLERFLGNLAGTIHDHAKKVIVVIVLLLAFPLSQAIHIQMDTSTEGFMHPNDPALLDYEAFKKQFGRDERIILAIESDNIYSIGFLEELKKLHQTIEEKVPYLNKVWSLYNVRHTRGAKDVLYTDSLLKSMPKDTKAVNEVRNQAMHSKYYKDLFVSRDGKMTTIIIETDAFSHLNKDENEANEMSGFSESEQTNKAFITDAEDTQLITALRQVIQNFSSKDMKIYLAGSPVVNNAIKAQMMGDMQIFSVVTFLIIITILYLMFKRISAVVYPLMVVIFSLVTTVGFMAYFDVAFKIPTQIVPSLLLAVSVGASVHLLTVFYDTFNKTGEKRASLIYAMQHSGLAIAMTSITTAIGVGSFAGSQMAPQADMGILGAIGVLIALFLTLVLLPALLSLTPLEKKAFKDEKQLDVLMHKFAEIPLKYYKQILLASFSLMSIGLLASASLTLSHHPLKWFSKENINRVSSEVIDTQMHGSVTIEVIIDKAKKDAWKSPLELNKLNRLSELLATYKDKNLNIGKVVSIATVLKETNRALHSNEESFYTIPKKQNLVSQELLLFENSGSDDLEELVDSQFSTVRMTIKIPNIDAVKSIEVLNYIKKQTKEAFPNDHIVTTGMVPLLINTFSQALDSSVASYVIALLAISVILVLILGSPRLGLLSIIPNIFPIVLGLLMMYVLDIPLDTFTMLIGSIAIGLAVDDTIHFMYNFKRYYLEDKNYEEAIKKTFFTTGKAMVITSLILSLGFYAYIFANMSSVQNFGLLTGSVILFALLSDLLLAPALVIYAIKRKFI